MENNYPSVNFILPKIGPSGGIISVLNLVNSLIIIGVDAKVTVTQPSNFSFPMLTEPVFFPYEEDLMNHIPVTDFFVATWWETTFLVDKLCNKYDKKQVYFCQDYEVDFYPEEDSATRARVRESYRLVDNKFAKTFWIINQLKKEGYDCFKINPGMNLDIFYPEKARDMSSRKFRVISMYRPSTKRRGSDFLIEILKGLSGFSNIEIVLFGENLNDDHGFKYTSLGKLSHKQLAAEYRQSDVFIDTSLFHGFGRTGLEAMACGCVPVMSDSGGIHEYAQHNKNCLIVSDSSVEKFISCIEKLMFDVELKKRLLCEGIRTSEKFCDNIAAEQFLRWIMCI